MAVKRIYVQEKDDSKMIANIKNSYKELFDCIDKYAEVLIALKPDRRQEEDFKYQIEHISPLGKLVFKCYKLLEKLEDLFEFYGASKSLILLKPELLEFRNKIKLLSAAFIIWSDNKDERKGDAKVDDFPLFSSPFYSINSLMISSLLYFSEKYNRHYEKILLYTDIDFPVLKYNQLIQESLDKKKYLPLKKWISYNFSGKEKAR